MKKQPKAQNKRKYAALFAALTLSAVSAFAAVRTLPTPPSSSYPDTESSVNVAVTNWPSLGRRVKLTLSANFTPSNCVQVALGQDTNADGDLAPEETMLCIGVDCGEPFARVESKSRVEVEQWNLSTCSAGQPEQEGDIHCSPSPSTFTLKLTRNQQSRWNLMKVTRRGFFSSEPTVTLKPRKPGTMIIVR